MNIIKCLFCSKATVINRINLKKNVNGKAITLTNAPVYYCAQCKEVFFSKESQDVLAYIRDRGLEAKSIIFSFDDMCKKMKD